jgi:hypothetical protein
MGGGISMLLSGSTTHNEMKSSKNTKTDFDAMTDRKEANKQLLLSFFEINIIRYGLTLGNVQPEDFDPFFLIDFISLPENYFLADAHQKYGKQIFV